MIQVQVTNEQITLADNRPVLSLSDDRQVIEIIGNGSVIEIINNQSVVEVKEDISVISIANVGTQGPVGPPGRSGNGSAFVYSFAFDVAATTEIAIVQSGKTVFKVEVIIQEPFDVAPDAFSIGDSINNTRLVGNSDIDATESGTYQTNPGYLYTSDTPINLYFTSGPSATAGTGLILIYIEA